MRCSSLVSALARFTAILVIASVLFAQANPAQRQPIARLGNDAIYEDDLLPSIGGQLLQLENQAFELRIKALTDLANRRLVESEAKSKGITVEEFLEETVDRNLPPWNVKELEGFYLARKDSIKKPLEEVRPQLEQAFLQARREQARQDYMNQLRQKVGLTILLHRPKAQLSVDLSRLRGNPDAPVTVLEFADFQCPYSQSMQPALKEILTKYQGKVRLGFRDFPLREVHPQAQAAAEAARCAGEQGKFWEYHDLLFTTHARLDSDGLIEHAHAAGLDVGRFSACLAGGKFRELIESDLSLGKAFGVAGTPTIYINGTVMTGSHPAAAFERIIESELANVKSERPTP